MLFVPQSEEVVFVSKRDIRKKDNSGSFSIVTVADPTTYENLDLFPKDASEFAKLEPGELICIQLEMSGRFTYVIRVA